MWGRKKKSFEQFVASQEIVLFQVYGSEYSIRLPLKEVTENGFSVLLGKYANENKAVIVGDYGYITPFYNQYTAKAQNYKKQKLLHYVKSSEFVTLTNQANIVLLQELGQVTSQYYLLLKQEDVRKYQCVMIVALLIEARLGMIRGTDDVYIKLSYQQELEKQSKIQSDLSHFRTLLGESNNLAAVIEMFEGGEPTSDGRVFIKEEAVREGELMTEMISLIDLKLAVYTEEKSLNANGNSNNGYYLNADFASWLMEYISNTSDRISFTDLYNT